MDSTIVNAVRELLTTFGIPFGIMIVLLILIVAGAVGALWLVATIWLRRKVESSFEDEFEKQRERRNNELSVELAKLNGDIQEQLDRARHALQGQLAQLQLYIGKQHRVYPRCYSLFKQAEGALVRPDIERSPDWKKAEKDDFIAGAKYWEIKEAHLAEVWTHLENGDRKRAGEAMSELIRQAKLKRGNKLFFRAKNYAIVNILYFSESVRDAVYDVISKMAEYSVYEEEPEDGGNQDQYRRGQQIGTVLNKLRDLMSAELKHTGPTNPAS